MQKNIVKQSDGFFVCVDPSHAVEFCGGLISEQKRCQRSNREFCAMGRYFGDDLAFSALKADGDFLFVP